MGKEAREGVIKFAINFHRNHYVDRSMIAEINGWRQVCFRLGLIGQVDGRYDGCAYGNISSRHQAAHSDGFLITGTQTGGIPMLRPDDYCHVKGCDPDRNTIDAEGLIEPSSEALTHGQLYGLNPAINCVIHVHSPEIWQHGEALNLPVTDAGAAYGTIAMAEAVAVLIEEMGHPDHGLFSMGGHQDGVVSFGASPKQAGELLVSTCARVL